MEEKQTITLTVEFQVKHSPGTDLHLEEILRNYLAPKGITLRDDLTIEV